MKMVTERIQYLAERCVKGEMTAEEGTEFRDFLTDENHRELAVQLIQQMYGQEKTMFDLSEETAAETLNAILASGRNIRYTEEDNKIRSMFNWRRWAVAASILLLISVGGYFYFNKNTQNQIATSETRQQRFKNDVAAPGKAKAMITLANGSTVALDSVANGTLATQGNVNVIKTADGKIVYNGPSTSSGSNAIVYNTLSNPRGSMVIDITLADGSRVWLNAGSSVTYPVAFVGNERKVEMTGEAYFEVAHDPSRKFLVSANGVTTQVLGTHFNINSYNDEAEIKITLLQGSVKVLNGKSSAILKPGQQAQVSDRININSDADIDQIIAWKNGMFKFKDASIETIMKQLEKWYDVEVNYDTKVTEHFVSTIPRNVPISEVIKVLETTGRVHFRIEGKKIIVTQ